LSQLVPVPPPIFPLGGFRLEKVLWNLVLTAFLPFFHEERITVRRHFFFQPRLQTPPTSRRKLAPIPFFHSFFFFQVLFDETMLKFPPSVLLSTSLWREFSDRSNCPSAVLFFSSRWTPFDASFFPAEKSCLKTSQKEPQHLVWSLFISFPSSFFLFAHRVFLPPLPPPSNYFTNPVRRSRSGHPSSSFTPCDLGFFLIQDGDVSSLQKFGPKPGLHLVGHFFAQTRPPRPPPSTATPLPRDPYVLFHHLGISGLPFLVRSSLTDPSSLLPQPTTSSSCVLFLKIYNRVFLFTSNYLER